MEPLLVGNIWMKRWIHGGFSTLLWQNPEGSHYDGTRVLLLFELGFNLLIRSCWAWAFTLSAIWKGSLINVRDNETLKLSVMKTAKKSLPLENLCSFTNSSKSSPHHLRTSMNVCIAGKMGCNCSSDYSDSEWIENLDEICEHCNCPIGPQSCNPVSPYEHFVWAHGLTYVHMYSSVIIIVVINGF